MSWQEDLDRRDEIHPDLKEFYDKWLPLVEEYFESYKLVQETYVNNENRGISECLEELEGQELIDFKRWWKVNGKLSYFNTEALDLRPDFDREKQTVREIQKKHDWRIILGDTSSFEKAIREHFKGKFSFRSFPFVCNVEEEVKICLLLMK